MIERIHHAGVTVKDLDRSIAFYCEALGLTLLSRRDGIEAEYVRGLIGHPDAVLDVAFVGADPANRIELVHYAAAGADPVRPELNTAGGTHLALTASDLDTVVDRIRAHGGQLVSDPQTATSGPNAGARFVFCRDPDGALVELVQPAPAGNQG